MHTRKSAAILTSVLALGAVSGTAGAAIIQYEFTGTVSEVYQLDATVQVGDPFSVALTYDTALASGTDYGVQQDFTFPTAPKGYSLDVQAGAFSGGAADGQISILNNFSGGQDWFQTLSGPIDGFAGDSVAGQTWKQTTITLKDYAGTLYVDTSLPDEIAELNNFEEAFATLFFDDPGGSDGRITAQIESIAAVRSLAKSAPVKAATKKAVIDVAAAGRVAVKTPAGTADGEFTAVYKQEAKLATTKKLARKVKAPGDIVQLWELDFDQPIVGGSVELELLYDDTGMSLAEELTLKIVHELDDGTLVRLPGTVDPDTNTILTTTTGFSSFYLEGDALVPEPATWLLLGVGLLPLLRGRGRAHGPGGA